ncbi:MAG: hypothetical protein ABIK89_24935 [Planctomycetota bacterium]
MVDITPREFPISMLGSFSDRQATSAHDPLEVRAIVLDDGRTRIAIAVCDNCVIPRELLDQAKQRANEQTGIPTERILVAATHAHTAPAVVVLSDIPVDSQYTKLLVAGAGDQAPQPAPALLHDPTGQRLQRLPADAGAARPGRLRDLALSSDGLQ